MDDDERYLFMYEKAWFLHSNLDHIFGFWKYSPSKITEF